MTGPCPLHYADRTRTEPLYSMGRSNRKGLHPIQPTGQMASVSPYVCFQRILGIGCPAGFGGHMFADFCLPIEDNGWPNRVRLKNGQTDPIGPVVWKGPKTTNPTINDDSKRGNRLRTVLGFPVSVNNNLRAVNNYKALLLVHFFFFNFFSLRTYLAVCVDLQIKMTYPSPCLNTYVCGCGTFYVSLVC